jgi:hypothetical protein
MLPTGCGTSLAKGIVEDGCCHQHYTTALENEMPQAGRMPERTGKQQQMLCLKPEHRLGACWK